MSDYIIGITEYDVEIQQPSLVGNRKWECTDGALIKYEGDEWAEKEIVKARARIAQVEAVRRAQVTVDHLSVINRADELCQVMYGQKLSQFEESAHQKFVRGLFRMAQHDLDREASEKLSQESSPKP